MTVTLNSILQRLAERGPIPVMARGILERCLNPEQRDTWFESVAEQQYTRTLSFSSLFGLMTRVVLRQQPSVNAAWQAAIKIIGVSVTSVDTQQVIRSPQAAPLSLIRLRETRAGSHRMA